jgi:GTP cyclohydrolase I
MKNSLITRDDAAKEVGELRAQYAKEYMNNKVFITHSMIDSMVGALDSRIEKDYPKAKHVLKVFAIPRGGIPVAYALTAHRKIIIVDNARNADIFIDDIYDSGATCQKWCDDYPGKTFYVLLDKVQTTDLNPLRDSWIVWPWEHADEQDSSITDNITRILQYVGEDPNREGLLETPARVAKAWQHWTSGYNADIPKLLKVFEDGAQNYDQMVMVKDIPLYSKCEHHLADIFGTATVAYIPNGKIVGLSKLSRVVDAFARRLQVQERLTAQIADAINDNLQPLGVGVIIKARHLCMESRGICQQGHHTITSALRGVMLTQLGSREEFMNLAGAR